MGAAGISGGKCAALALLALALSVSAFILIDSLDDSSAETIYDKNIIYETIGEDRKVAVTGLLNKTVTDVNIPDSITHNGFIYEVTSIYSAAFSVNSDEGYKNIKTVRLSEKLDHIWDNAFYGCESLQSITVPSTVTVIDEYAFAESGIRTATINGVITNIPANMFCGCINLTTVKLTATVISIGEKAFYGCNSLTNLTLPEDLKELGDRVFEYCSSLKSIILPGSLISVGESVFAGCSSLEEIKLPAISTVPKDMFNSCYSLKKVEFNRGVTGIGVFAFHDCRSLSELTSYENIRTIGLMAFYGCRSLRTLEITTAVQSIGNYAFADCVSLKYITLPSSVKTMGVNVFGDTVFYDQKGAPITDQSRLPGYSYEMKDNKMTITDGCYYEISYNVDGGSVALANSKVNYDSTFVITQYEGVKEGYVFAGWSCEGINYLLGDTYTMPGHSVEFTIIWNKYVPSEDNSLINAETIKFIIWAGFSIAFGCIILAASTLIIYRRRH